MGAENVDVHIVTSERTGKVYVLAEDVARVLEEFAASEETDVRNRLTKLAQNFKKSKAF